MSNILNRANRRKERKENGGITEEERRKAFEAGFKEGSRWTIRKSSNEATKLVFFQLLMILEEKFNFSSNSKGTGKLDIVYKEFLKQILKMNNDIDNFTRKVMQDKLERNNGLGLRFSEEDGMLIVKFDELEENSEFSK